MDWKREAIDKLRCYEAKKSSISRSEEEIRRLEGEIARLRGTLSDKTPVIGGSSTKEDMLVNNIAQRQELRQPCEKRSIGLKL